MSTPGEAVSLAAKRMQRHPAPKPPINSLCNSDEPEDVLAAARSVVEFVRAIHLSEAMDTERDSREYRGGLIYVLNTVAAAMEYASALCTAAREDRQD